MKAPRTMEEKRELLAALIHAVTLGAYQVGGQMAVGIPARIAVMMGREAGQTFLREDGKGYDLADDSVMTAWERLNEEASSGTRGAVSVRDHSLREADVLMSMLFDEEDHSNALLREVNDE